ncbi:MAG: shikimate dehydrogenase [Pseudomonadota bacterium]
MRIDQRTELYGVAGYPIGHSLSPTMHNTAFSKMGLNAVYLAFQARDIKGCLAGMKALGIKGMSVTIPHKSEVIPLLNHVDDLAERIGAVNTIVNQDGRMIGFNTDAVGALRALEEKTELAGKRSLIVGAGGAARAIGFILKKCGAYPTIANRNIQRGKELSDFLGCPFVPISEIKNAQADLLIQTTPVGMYPHIEECILSEDTLMEGMVVMDVIYNPHETRLLRMARDRGCVTIGGLSMFIQQGAEQFRLWTGLEPPVEEMTKAVKEVLDQTPDERD